MRFFLVAAVSTCSLAACATVEPAPERVAPEFTSAEMQRAQVAAMLPDAPRLKHRIAVGRFSNATNYGRVLLRTDERDPLADQVSDMLVSRLVDSERFIVFERSDLDVIDQERELTGATDELPGVEALIVGSLTQFGRRTEGQAGFLSSTMRQAVEATVEIRLVDVDSGRAFYAAEGRGVSTNESGEVAGFGSRAGYDATLNDQAIGAAVDDLVNRIIRELAERQWATDVLRVRDGSVFIAGGPSSGLAVGDRFIIETVGDTVRSEATGGAITLPGERLAEIEVVSFFGDSELNEGAVAHIVSGALPDDVDVTSLIVKEDGQ